MGAFVPRIRAMRVPEATLSRGDQRGSVGRPTLPLQLRKRNPKMQTLLLHQAAKIVELSLQTGREIGCKPPTVAVLDAGGHLLAFQRADGSGILRPQIAQTKRRGVLGMGHGGRASAQRAAATPGFFAALSGISEGRIAPVPGGHRSRPDRQRDRVRRHRWRHAGSRQGMRRVWHRFGWVAGGRELVAAPTCRGRPTSDPSPWPGGHFPGPESSQSSHSGLSP
ncbi:MAG: hypothetical protein JWQ73_2075 [Variovorax sp.]|nr:hypothetical protein [Variovorax sp.]